MKDFTGRTAAITGAASGIGRALATQLAASGCHLALADIDTQGLQELAAELSNTGVRCTTHLVDVAQRDQVEAYAVSVAEAHGGVHLVFNNAGVDVE